MKSVGIITFWDSEDNYGQVLQCYALNLFLRRSGYDAYLIRNKNEQKKLSFKKIVGWTKYLFSPIKLMNAIRFKINVRKHFLVCSNHPRNFDSFRKKHIPSTAIYSSSELFNNPPIFDAFVCGSDQIWSGLSPLHYLQFVPSPSKKIAYAVSMGGFKPNTREIVTLKKYVSDFDYVSLREKQAVDFFEMNNICEVECVPDPTLLLDAREYKSLYAENEQKQRRPYLFLYLLGNKSNFDLNELYAYAKKKNLDVVYVASQGRFDEYEKMYPSIEEWLGLIEGAELVVTNSFHGTVFSMIYQKKFVTLLLTGTFSKMNDRITDMLAKYGLENRIFCENWEEFAKEVNYSKFENVLAEEKLHIQEKMLNVIG